MNPESFQAVYRDDRELMGYIAQDNCTENVWIPITIFKIPFGKEMDKSSAVSYVLEKGLQVLTERWEYFDKDSNEWKFCLIMEANPNQVTIQEGFYPNSGSKIVVFENPSHNELRLYR